MLYTIAKKEDYMKYLENGESVRVPPGCMVWKEFYQAREYMSKNYPNHWVFFVLADWDTATKPVDGQEYRLLISSAVLTKSEKKKSVVKNNARRIGTKSRNM
jgi:hypothetical protein